MAEDSAAHVAAICVDLVAIRAIYGDVPTMNDTLSRAMIDGGRAALRRTLCVTLTACGLCAADALSAQEAYTLSDLSFLTGCWAGQMGALDMREQWTDAEGGAMLGTTRFLRGGAVVDWEFARIVEDDEGVTLWPYPKGERSEHGFPLISADGDGGYVFENLEHDFPVRIIYVRDGPDSLAPRIEGPDGNGPGWSIRRTECPTAR